MPDLKYVDLVIDRQVFADDGTYTWVTEPRTLRAIYNDIQVALKGRGIKTDDLLDYFSIHSCLAEKSYFPTRWKWIAVYTVKGGSEGWYIHVDTIDENDVRTLQFLGKSLSSLDDALVVANALTHMLQW